MCHHIKLRAFELADEVAVLVYLVTPGFPKEELYGLTSQMRRVAVSVPSNIVWNVTVRQITLVFLIYFSLQSST